MNKERSSLFFKVIGWGLFCFVISWARIYFSALLWPPGAGFEEVQLGALATVIVRKGELPIEFRFSNITGALGFALGGFSIDGLRSGFVLTGTLSIVLFVVAALIHRLRPFAILWGAVTIGLSYYFVVLSHFADELCYNGTLTVIALSALLFFASRSRWLWMRYAVFAAVCGALFYEYAGLKVLACFCFLAGAQTVRRDFRESSRAEFAAVVLGAACLFGVIVRSQFLEIIEAQGGASFFDSLRRHLSDKSIDSVASPGWQHLLEHMRFLLGLLRNDARLVPSGHGAFPVYFGALLLCSVVWGLLSGRWIPFTLASCSIFLIVMASFLPGNFEPIRITPAIACMFFLSCMMLDWLLRISLSERTSPRARGFLAGILLIWAGELGYTNYTLAEAWRTDIAVKGYFSEGDYFTCSYIAKKLSPDVAKVEIVAPRGSVFCAENNDGRWLYREDATVVERGEPGKPVAFPGRVLVVIANRHGLVESDINWLEACAQLSGFSGVEIGRDLKGRAVAASFCSKCG